MIDERSDIYSLGCTLYFLLTARLPFEGKLMEVLIAHQTKPAPSLRDIRPEVSQGLDAVFAKMMAKDPADRFQSMLEVAAELDEQLARPSPRRKPLPGGSRAGLDETASPKMSDRQVKRPLAFDFGTIGTRPAFFAEYEPLVVGCSLAEPFVGNAVLHSNTTVTVGQTVAHPRSLTRLLCRGKHQKTIRPRRHFA